MNSCIFYLVLVLGFFSCANERSGTKENSRFEGAGAMSDEISGAALAKIHCSGCHQFPEPKLLDRNTWKRFILPRMGLFFGIYETDTIRQSLIEGGRAGQIVEKRNIFPLYPTLDTAIFKKIKKYYLD